MNSSWNTEALWARLEPLLPGLSVEVMAHCPSTNTALLDRARLAASTEDAAQADGIAQVRRSRESAAFGRRAADVQPCLLVAEHQTHGRGRMGRTWVSSKGDSLTFSLALPMAPGDWSGLSLAVGVAIADALEPGFSQGAPRLGLKWPNDIWMLDGTGSGAIVPLTRPGRKLGGILIETCAVKTGRLVVVGVGLNIRPAPRAERFAQEHASLQEIDPQASAATVLSRIAMPLVQTLLEFNRSGFEPFAARFAARDLLCGRKVQTTHPDALEGVAQGVSASGALRVHTASGLREVVSGEVSVHLPPSVPPVAACAAGEGPC